MRGFFAQLSDHTPDTKYNSSMEQIAKIIEKFCTFPEVEKNTLFARVLFNYHVGNEDIHLKNFSLLTLNDKVQLSLGNAVKKWLYHYHDYIYCDYEYTLKNLYFADLVEPHNKYLHEKFDQVNNRRFGEKRKKINPFLRCTTPEIISVVEVMLGKN